jgi:hypothetical protein
MVLVEILLGWDGTCLPVSGKNTRNRLSQQEAKMTRNQNMLLQPRNSERIPPITGPIAGPKRAPAATKPIYFPRSAAVATSATTPLERAIVPLLPLLWRHLSKKSAA